MLTEYFYKGLATKNSPESFTKFIRNLSLEGCEEDSRATFVKLVPYATPEQIEDLVTGRSTLSGKTSNGHIDNPSIIDADHEDYLRFEKDVNFVFRGLFQHSDGFYYRPYAYVSSYGIFDIFCKKPQMEMVMSIINKMDCYSEKSHKDMLSKQVEKRINLKKGLDLNKKTLVKRAKHYARSKEDLAIEVSNDELQLNNVISHKVVLLCSRHEDAPPSFRKHKNETPEGAVKELKEYHCELEEYGNNISYSDLFGFNVRMQMVFLSDIISRSGRSEEIDNFLSERDKEYKEDYLSFLKMKILKESKIEKHGFVDLKDNDGNIVATVPYLPLLCWAMERISKTEETLDYTAQSVSGLKLPNDCPFHSDWMIGGGLDLVKDYSSDSPVQSAAYNWLAEMQFNRFKFKHVVLAKGKKVSGKIRHCTPSNAAEVMDGDIVVIPTGNPEYQLHVEAATRSGGGGVIAQVGNKVAHLSIVSRERGVTMFQMNDAFKLLPEGMMVTLDPENGDIKMF